MFLLRKKKINSLSHTYNWRYENVLLYVNNKCADQPVHLQSAQHLCYIQTEIKNTVNLS